MGEPSHERGSLKCSRTGYGKSSPTPTGDAGRTLIHMPRVIIIGGGLSGLAAAFRIRQTCPGVELLLLEGRNRLGGNVHTEVRDGFTVEHGPNGFLDSKPSTIRLCLDLGLGDRLLAASEGSRKNRYVYLHDQLHALPASPLGLLRTPVLSWKGKLTMLAEPFRRWRGDLPEDESVAAFARRRFGREAADVFVDALVTGIHAGDPEALSVRAAFPRLPLFEKQDGSVLKGFLRAAKQRRTDAAARGETPGPTRMWSFPGGLQELIDALAKELGGVTRCGVTVDRIEKIPTGWRIHGNGETWDANIVIDTTPAHAQAEHLRTLDPTLAAELSAIRYNRIAVAVLSYREADAPLRPDGFGYIAPQNTRRDVLGVQWCSAIFPGRAPAGLVLWRALCGGVNRADAADLPDGELLRTVHREMAVVMKVTAEPVFARVIRWPRAIPQYEVGHPARVGRIEARVAGHPGLILGGNHLHGVALNDCTEQAERIAGQVSQMV